jgi:hypothetical protein
MSEEKTKKELLDEIEEEHGEEGLELMAAALKVKKKKEKFNSKVTPDYCPNCGEEL